jgi:uncharacterized protein YeaO (DUF488 family)
MPEDVRIWEVGAGDKLTELGKAKLDLEKRIETWLEQDISIISDDLLVIGRQVTTNFGGAIDLLCLDHNGDAVIVELKRDKTPRDITAQVLDYASWVKELSNERITELAEQYLGERGSLEQAFEQKFGEELPETLNGQHKMLIVASDIDASTERIVNYLSDTCGADINAVSFQYFRHVDNREFLARVFLIEPSQVEYSARTKSTSKRRPNLTYKELQKLADDNDVGELYKQLVEGLTVYFDSRDRTRSSITFIGNMEGKRNTIFSLIPGDSSAEKGVRFQTFIDRLVQYLGTEKESLLATFPPNTQDYEPWEGAPPHLAGFFCTRDDITRFLSSLRKLRAQ